MPHDPFSTYLSTLQADHQAGNATEHTYRPALKTLLETLDPKITATNEPKRFGPNAPDYIVTRPTAHGPLTAGYIEAKDIGLLTKKIENSPQMKRYLESFRNLVLTDYLEFRWYVDGVHRKTEVLATRSADKKLMTANNGPSAVAALLQSFLNYTLEPITSASVLARRMAHLSHQIRDIIVAAFEHGNATNFLKGWRKAFAEVLIAELDQPEKTPEFADMFAQTLAYGLFSARVMDTTTSDFSRDEAKKLIPRTNPFLRDFFEAISGNRLEDEPFVHLVNDLVALFGHADMDEVLTDFGKRKQQQDPVIHFYETFLAAYDPRLRKSRGVYYTPEPVVSYIVRSVDHILQNRFNLPMGLADSAQVTIPNSKFQNPKSKMHKVLVLDPATGTGTFLYAVVDLIRRRFMEGNNAGMWSDYVREHLLPRLFGFELLMAPYAVAHFKLGLQLAGRDLPEEQRANWAYDFATNERLGIYLTNTLEAAHEHTGLPLFTHFLSDESQAANSIKRDLPIMVVMGNPPYSGHSANTGKWINDLLRGKDVESGNPTGNYFEMDGKPLGERNPKWLNDDYVKFIRFAQWRIERSGAGILAFISNNGYLDNPTFRGMRQSLMQTFDEIYILNLHGNSKKKETAPDGSPDHNVFDIQQGVAIALMVKYPQGK